MTTTSHTNIAWNAVHGKETDNAISGNSHPITIHQTVA